MYWYDPLNEYLNVSLWISCGLVIYLQSLPPPPWNTSTSNIYRSPPPPRNNLLPFETTNLPHAIAVGNNITHSIFNTSKTKPCAEQFIMRFPMSPKGLWNNRFVNRIVTNFTKQEEPHFDIQNFDMSFHQVDDDSVVVPKVRNKATFITGWKRKVKGVNALGEEGLRLIKQAQLDSAEVEGEAEGSSAQQVVHPGRLVTHLNGRNISDDDLAMASVRTGGQDSFELSYSPPPALVGLGGEGASGFIESVENHEGFQGVLSHRRVHVDHHGKIWTELSDGTFRTWLYSRHPGLPELDDEIGLDFPRDPVKINRMSPVDYAS